MCVNYQAPIMLSHILTQLVASMSWVEGPFWGTKFSQITTVIAKSSVLLVFYLFSKNSSTMPAVGAIRSKHSTDGGIQWLSVKPRMCSIGRCAPLCTAAPARQSKLPAIHMIFLYLSIRCLHNTSKLTTMSWSTWIKSKLHYCSCNFYKPIHMSWAPAVDDECRFLHHFWLWESN